MKNKKLSYIPVIVLVLFTAYSCDYNRFDPVSAKDVEDLPAATHTIAELKSLYRYGSGGTNIAEDIVVHGVVATSDRKGNFYRTLSIQDETGGIELKMGMANLSLLYRQGTEVAVLCQNLTLGQYGEMVNLGFPSNQENYETAYVPDLMVPKVMIAGRYVGIEPVDLTIVEISKSRANTLIRLSDVQFLESELGQTYADPVNKNNVSAVNRTLTDKNGNTIVVRTSSYAAFAGKKLPEGSGSIVALLTYFRDTPQLVINDDVEDLNLTSPRF